jgi:hypothetical protein
MKTFFLLLTRNAPALLLGLFMAVTLSACITVKCQDCDKACDEVVSDGKGDIGTQTHWSCRKTPNGQGGYACAATYEGKTGCNSCPTCACRTVGSGASQNCLCQQQ